MARTPQQIIDDAVKTFNPNRQSNGLLSRADLLEFISTLTDGDKRAQVKSFLDQCPFITEDDKLKVMAHIDDYNI